MTMLSEITIYLDQLLQVDTFQDYCPNGLQVEGRLDVSLLVSGVTASQAFIDAAIHAKADAILVHHGFFWKNEASPIVGIKKNRIKALLENNISLLAYHLPLDAHQEYGNNVALAHILDLLVEGPVMNTNSSGLVFQGDLDTPLTGEQFASHLEARLGRSPLHVPAEKKNIQRLAWCTGGAQSYIQEAIDAGVDAFVTGEISEQTVHIARESNLHFYAAGHHATERYGVQMLGEHLAQQFQIQHQFIDIDNPA